MDVVKEGRGGDDHTEGSLRSSLVNISLKVTPNPPSGCVRWRIMCDHCQAISVFLSSFFQGCVSHCVINMLLLENVTITEQYMRVNILEAGGWLIIVWNSVTTEQL